MTRIESNPLAQYRKSHRQISSDLGQLHARLERSSASWARFKHMVENAKIQSGNPNSELFVRLERFLKQEERRLAELRDGLLKAQP